MHIRVELTHHQQIIYFCFSNALFKQSLEEKAESLKLRTCECKVQSSKQKMKQITAAICRTSLNENSEVEVIKEDTAHAHPSSYIDLHILDLFLPGLESLTHLREAREVVLEKGTLEMLLGYFCLLCQKQVTDDEEVCIVI